MTSQETQAKAFLQKIVSVTIDRPMGSAHPEWGFVYPVNYGYVKGTISGDGEPLDAYVLGVSAPYKTFQGQCVAVIHRQDDDDDKLIVVPEGVCEQLVNNCSGLGQRIANRTNSFLHQFVVMLADRPVPDNLFMHPPEDVQLTNTDIRELTKFQEQFFQIDIIRQAD